MDYGRVMRIPLKDSRGFLVGNGPWRVPGKSGDLQVCASGLRAWNPRTQGLQRLK